MKGATAFVIYMTRFVIFKETETVNPNPSHTAMEVLTHGRIYLT